MRVTRRGYRRGVAPEAAFACVCRVNAGGPEEPPTAPHFPERSGLLHLGPPLPAPVGADRSPYRPQCRTQTRQQNELERFRTATEAGSARGRKAMRDRGLEPPLDELVEHADDAVELARVEVLEQRRGR